MDRKTASFHSCAILRHEWNNKWYSAIVCAFAAILCSHQCVLGADHGEQKKNASLFNLETPALSACGHAQAGKPQGPPSAVLGSWFRVLGGE